MSTEPIVCRVTSWYHKRRIAMLVMVLGFSAYFYYDWKIGYPLKREASEKMAELKAEKRESEYAALAAEKGWPASPEEKSADQWDYAITEQLVFAILTAVCGSAMLVFYFRTIRGTLTADDSSFTPPGGRPVAFASAFRIDRRKWDHKGLAYVYYRDGSEKEKRAVIDDLIYGGAAKVLERLQANFKGELIDLEKVPDPAAEPSAESAESPAPAAGQAAAAAAAAADPGSDKKENA